MLDDKRGAARVAVTADDRIVVAGRKEDDAARQAADARLLGQIGQAFVVGVEHQRAAGADAFGDQRLDP